MEKEKVQIRLVDSAGKPYTITGVVTMAYAQARHDTGEPDLRVKFDVPHNGKTWGRFSASSVEFV